MALLSAVGSVLFLGAGLALLIADRHFNPNNAYFLIGGLALAFLYTILDPTALPALVASRAGRFGSLSLVVSAVFLAILAMLNVFASRGTQTLDLTKYKKNTLSVGSIQAVGKLDADLTVIGFYIPGQEDTDRHTMADELSLYQAQSSHVKVQFEDPNTSLTDLRNYNVQQSETLVLLYKGNTQLLAQGSQTEQDITSAILRLESTRVVTICWAVGEGEADLTNTDPVVGYSEAEAEITRLGYKTQELILTAQTQIPSSCDILAVVGPQSKLSDTSVKMIGAYLKGGGKLLMAADPWQNASSENQILQPYGLSFDGGLVMEGDPSKSIQNFPQVLDVTTYGSSPITNALHPRQATILDQTTFVSGTATGGSSTAVASSSDQSYAIATPRPADKLGKQTGDKAGPFDVLETFQGDKTTNAEIRIALAGTSAFADNQVLGPQVGQTNDGILDGTLRWLAEQDNLITIPPKASSDIVLTLTDQQVKLIIALTVLVMPLLVLSGGALVWISRRSVV